MSAEFIVSAGRLEVRCSGPCSQTQILEWIDRIGETKREHPDIVGCLIDCRRAEFEIGTFGRFEIGEHAARRLAGQRLRVVLLARAHMITRVVENTAHNRGLSMFTTHDPAEAEAWLAIRQE